MECQHSTAADRCTHSTFHVGSGGAGSTSVFICALHSAMYKETIIYTNSLQTPFCRAPFSVLPSCGSTGVEFGMERSCARPC